MNYNNFIKFYPDFPIKGVNFVDIIPFPTPWLTAIRMWFMPGT